MVYDRVSTSDDVPHKVIPGIYRHYKGGTYHILGVIRNANTEERMVLYMPLETHDGKLPMLSGRSVSGPDGFFTPVIHVGQEVERYSLLCRTNTTHLEQFPVNGE